MQWKRKNWFRACDQKCPGPALSLSSLLTFFVHLKVIELLLSADCIFCSPSFSRAQPSPAAVSKAPRLSLQWPNASKCCFPSHSPFFLTEKLIYPAGPDGHMLNSTSSQMHQLKSPFQRASPHFPMSGFTPHSSIPSQSETFRVQEHSPWCALN